MKNLLTITLLILSFSGFAQKYERFGAKISPKNPIESVEISKKMNGQESLTAKVSGVVESVCQAKGCWMKVKTADGQTMRVTFKDYGFFVPKDLAGKTVIFEGLAKVKTTPIDELRHYAEDAGKSKEEIAKITEPERAITFVADGVLVEDK
jgi:hypothetical protein